MTSLAARRIITKKKEKTETDFFFFPSPLRRGLAEIAAELELKVTPQRARSRIGKIKRRGLHVKKKNASFIRITVNKVVGGEE